jgi:hypothetical protein
MVLVVSQYDLHPLVLDHSVYIPNPGTFAYAVLKKLGAVAQKKYGIKV